MPAGNDQAAAVADLIAKGGTSTNVERLISAQRASVSPALEAAGAYSRDEAATAELDSSEYEVPEGHTVLDAAVRGPYAVYVIEGPDGRTYKEVEAHQKGFEMPERSGAEAVAAERAKANASVAADIAQIRGEAEQQLEEERQRIEAETSKKVQQLQEDAQKRVEAAYEDAEKSADAEDAEDAEAAQTAQVQTAQAEAPQAPQAEAAQPGKRPTGKKSP